MAGQNKKHSFIEACINTAIGFWIAILTQSLVFPLFGIQASFVDQLGIGAVFTVVSIVRGYLVRRLFNYIHIKGIL